MIAHAACSPLLAVLGPSGSGKSSVVRAGLIPMLKAGALPGSDRWHYALAGGGFEPGLVEELVTQTLDRPGALPLLEYTLQELWKQRQPDGTMTWDTYQTLGGIEGTLAARADALLVERYTLEQQDDLRRLLLRLVQPGEGAADTRRRAFLADLVPVGNSLDSIQALVKPLADERLLTTSRDDITGAQTVEISHEALIRAWPAFGRWIADARADLRFQLQLEQAAREWQASGENADLLWIGLRLAQAAAWIERAQPQLNACDQAFLDASRAQLEARRRAQEAMRHERESLLEARASAERRNAARLRIFLAIGSVLLLIAIGLIIYVFNQGRQLTTALTQAQQQYRISDAQANAGEALFELTRGNGDRALLLA